MTSGRGKDFLASRGGGSALVVTLVTLTALSLMAAYTLTRVGPRARMAYQNAAWQEARVSAEAGIDVGMNDLLVNATRGANGAWPGWQEEKPASTAPPATTPGGGLLGSVLNTVTNTVSNVPSLVNGLVTSPTAQLSSIVAQLLGSRGTAAAPIAVNSTDNTVASSTGIYLDNVRVSATSGQPSEVDIRLWALQPKAAPHIHWFRIRSMATTALPPTAVESPANLDGLLRRFSLKKVRPSVRKNDVGAPSTIPLPNVSRTVEALVEPILPYELALWSNGSVALSSTGAWNIDSFDSSDPQKSNGGLYPGRKTAAVQANGHLASGMARPFDSRYGPTIAANGTNISGAVATNGGDNPDTEEHENVSGALGIAGKRIRDDFSREMPLMERPALLTTLPPPPSGTFVPGTADAPAVYTIPSDLTKVRIQAPPDQATGVIVLMVNGNLDLAAPLIIPPSVVALIYVRGNISFHDAVNSGPWSSNRAGQLFIFGDRTGPDHQKLETYGDTTICAAFYGPNTDIALDGGTSWVGALAGGAFRVKNGGDGGIHYDEVLATIGTPISFRISRYIEDVRE